MNETTQKLLSAILFALVILSPFIAKQVFGVSDWNNNTPLLQANPSISSGVTEIRN